MVDISFLVGVGSATFIMATPVLFAATGEIIGQRSGVMNLGIEGMMATGAFVGLLAAIMSNSLWLGVASAILFTIILSTFLAFMTLRLRVNQIIAGLLLVMLGEGISYFGNRTFHLTIQAGVKPFAPLLFNQNILVYLALIVALIAGIVLFKTSVGLKVRAVGENPRAADSAGIEVNRTKLLCVTFGGAMAGLAGASLTLGLIGHFGEGMVAGRGWIAIIVVILSKWNPFIAIASSLLFGFAYALGARLMITDPSIPYHFLLMLPYFLALILVILVFRRAKGPAALLKPYTRG